MNRLGRAAILLALGAVMVRLILSGGFGWFVQQRMKWPLAVAAVVLVVLGLVEALAGARAERADPHDARRPVGPAVGWMLALPLLVLIAVAPTGLGAAAADRVASFTPAEEDSAAFEPLAPSEGPVPMRLYDFLNRAIWDDQASLDGTEVELIGLVVNDPAEPDSFKLTRFLVSCCAADGIPLQVRIRGAGTTFADDTWVRVVATWRPPDKPYPELERPWLVEADAVDVTVIPDPPDSPYESPY